MDPYITRGRALGKVNGVCVANILHQSIFQYYFHCWKFIQINRVLRFFKMGFQRVLGLGTWGKESRESHNLKSVTHFQVKVMEILNKKIELGRIAGPFSSKPLPNLIVSPSAQG